MEAVLKKEEKSVARQKAELIIDDAKAVIGNEAIRNIVVPTVERVMRGDVEIVDLWAGADTGLVKAVRSKGLGYRLRRIGLDDTRIQVAVRFSRDFEKAKIGNLTANYDGFAGGAKRASEPERMCEAMDLLTKALRGPVGCPLTHDERVALLGYVVCDVPLGDLGEFVVSGLTADKNMQVFTGKLCLVKALTKLEFFYEDWDYLQSSNGN